MPRIHATALCICALIGLLWPAVPRLQAQLPIADDSALPPGMERYIKRAYIHHLRDTESSDIRELFEDYGVHFPPGASIRYNSNASKLIVTNTPEELKRINRILDAIIKQPSQLELNLTCISIPRQLAGDWGLDGLPPAKPETMPFPHRIPRTLDYAAAATLFAALRRQEGFRVLASASVTTISGNTANSQNVDRFRLVEGYTFGDSTTDADGTTTTQSPGQPEFSEERELGMTFTITPTVGDDDYTVDIELRPSFNIVTGYIESRPIGAAPDSTPARIPVITEYSTETRVLLFDGETILLGVAQRNTPAPPRDSGEVRYIPLDTGMIFYTLSVHLVRPGFDPETQRDTKRPVGPAPETAAPK